LVTKTHGYKKREREREVVTKTGIERDGYKKRDREMVTKRELQKIRDRDGYKTHATISAV
jgi:hypothetical protein